MKEIKLTNGGITIVDDEDFEELSKHKWYGNRYQGKVYVKRKTKISDNRKEKLIFMHRQIMNFPSCLVDHINRDTLDNRHSNLRYCTPSENTRNRIKSNKNTSGFKGVSFYPRLKKWRAAIYITIGYFDTKEEAAKEYDNMAKNIHKDFSRLNFADEKKDVT